MTTILREIQGAPVDLGQEPGPTLIAGIQIGEGSAGFGQLIDQPNFSFVRSGFPGAPNFLPDQSPSNIPNLSYNGAWATLCCNPSTSTVISARNISSVTFNAAGNVGRITFNFYSPFRDDININNIEDYAVLVNCKKTTGTAIDTRIGACVFRRSTRCQVQTSTRAQVLDIQEVVSVICFQK